MEKIENFENNNEFINNSKSINNNSFIEDNVNNKDESGLFLNKNLFKNNKDENKNKNEEENIDLDNENVNIYDDYNNNDNNNEDVGNKVHEVNEKPSKIKNAAFMFIELFGILIILFSPFGDISILTLPYSVFGIAILLLVRTNNTTENTNFKNFLFKIIFFYAILNLCFKIAMFIFFLIDKNRVFFIENYQLLRDLGLKFLKEVGEKDPQDITKLYTYSFITEVSILIVCFINKVYSFNPENRICYNIPYNRNTIYIFLGNIISLAITVINISPYSMAYGLMIQIGFACWAFGNHHLVFKLLSRISIFLIIIEMIATNIVNIPTIAKERYELAKDFGIIYLRDNENDWRFVLNYLLHHIVLIIYFIANFSLEENSINTDQSNSNIIIDEGKEQSNWVYNFLNKIKLMLISPSFNYHLARIGCLTWIFLFPSFVSMPILFFLFYSFFNVEITKSIKILSIFLIWPVFIIAYNMYMLSNIISFQEKHIFIPPGEELIYENYNLKAFKYRELMFSLMHLIIFIFTLFNHTLQLYLEKKEIKIVLEENENIIELNDENMVKLEEKLMIDNDDNSSKNDSLKITRDSKVGFQKVNEEEKVDKLTFFYIASKLFILHIDKITILLMYFVVVQSINVVHFILMILFLIQINFPSMIKKIVVYLIIILQFELTFEFIWDFIKVRINVLDWKTAIDIIITFDADLSNKTPEPLIGLIMYCFFIQYQIYSSKIYKSYEEDKTDVITYLKDLLKNHRKLRGFVKTFLVILQGILIWILITVFFIFIILPKTYSILFSFKLILLNFVIFNFCINNTNTVKIFIWILIIYCMFNTILVYLFQFTLISDVLIWVKENIFDQLPDSIVKNFNVFGLEAYKDNLFNGLLPHYGSNLMSIWILSEIERISELFNLQSKSSKAPERLSILNDDNDKISIKDTIDVKFNKNSFSENEMEEGLYLLNYTSKINDNKKRKVSYVLFIAYQVLIFLSQSYCMFIFFTNSLLFLYYQVSVSMFLYIFLFCILYLILFYRLINTPKYSELRYSFSLMIRTKIIEEPKIKNFLNDFRTSTFKVIIICGMSIVVFTYLFGCFYQIQYLPNNYPIFDKDSEEKIIALSYMFGIYVNPFFRSFMQMIWGHILIIGLVIIDKYLFSLEEILIDQVAKMEKDIRHNNWIEANQIEKSTINENVSIETKENENEDNHIEYVKKSKRKISQEEKQSTFLKNRNLINLLKEYSLDINVSNLLRSFRTCEDKANISINENNKSKNIHKTIKVIIEELLVLLLFIIIITKLNVYSIIYLLMIFLIFCFGKTPKVMYVISIMQILIILIQIIFFISDLSRSTDPYYTPAYEKELSIVFDYIKTKLNVPWYEDKISADWGFYLSLGVKYYEIGVLITDFTLIILQYFYFSYMIRSDLLKKSVFNSKLAFKNYTLNKSFNNSILSHNEKSYNEIKNNLKENFEIEIIDYTQVKDMIKRNEKEENYIKDSMISNNNDHNSEDKKSSLLKNIYNAILSIIFMYFHQIILVLILIISLNDSNLINLVYTTFSIYYLVKSRSLIVGEKFNYNSAIRKFLTAYLIIDIFLQVVYQNPLNAQIKGEDDDNAVKLIIRTLGLNLVVDYAEFNIESDDFIKKDKVVYLSLKTLTYFLISLQISIYSSSLFKTFYIKSVLKFKNVEKKHSLMSSFVYNNKRILSMNSVIENRTQIKQTLVDLENELEYFNKNFFNEGKNDEVINENKENSNEIDRSNLNKEILLKENELKNEIEIKNDDYKNNDYEEIKESIKKSIKESFLSSFVISSYYKLISFRFVPKIKRNDYMRNVIKGNISCQCEIEDQIDEFINQIHFSEYNSEELLKVIANYKEAISILKEIEKENKKLENQDNENKLEKEDSDKESDDDNNKSEKENVKSKDKNLYADRSYILKDNVKIDSEEISILRNIDVTKYDTLLKNILFSKHLSTWSLLKYEFTYIFQYLVDNRHIFIYFTMFIYPFLNGTIISTIWIIILFGFALIENPRPKFSFWYIVMIILNVILILKFICQFKALESTLNVPILKWLGFQRYKTSSERLGYFIWEVLILFFILFEQYNLVKKGLWIKTEDEIESLYEALYRVNKYKHSSDNEIDSYINKIFISNYHEKEKSTIIRKLEKYRYNKEYIYDEKRLDNISLKSGSTKTYSQKNRLVSNATKTNAEEIEKNLILSKMDDANINTLTDSKKLNFYQRFFPRIRNFKPGSDFYWCYFIPLLFAVLYLIIFFSKLQPDENYNANNTKTKIKQFSGTMVLIVFFVVLIMILDRSVYLKQNRNNVELEYFFFDKVTGKQLRVEEVNKRKLEEIHLDKKSYEVTYIQYEEENYPLKFKYIMNLIVIIFVISILYIYLPFSGNYNKHSSFLCDNTANDDEYVCNYYSENSYLRGLFFFFGIYLLFSSLQVSYGLLDMRKQALLMRGDNLFYNIAFKTYKAIPFLYEMKLTLDWTLTTTSLDLFKWIKFEQVYDLLFITHCTMKSDHKKKVGSSISIIEKLFIGFLSFFILIVILIGPLLLFSNLNPITEFSNPIGANVNLQICFNINERYSNFTIYKTNLPKDISIMTKNVYDTNNYGISTLTKNFLMNEINVVSMFQTSDTNWDLTEPKIKYIIEHLENYKENMTDIYLSFRYEFKRTTVINDISSEKHIDYQLYARDPKKKEKNNIEFLENLLKRIKFCEDQPTIMKKFLYQEIRLPQSPHPKTLFDKNNFSPKDVNVVFTCKFKNVEQVKEIDYPSSFFSLELDKNQGIEFHTFSDKISTGTGNMDVITFYATFIIVIGNAVRGIISGEAEKIVLTEMPEPKKLINLCEGIKISRYRQNLDREEHLYYVLIDFMRSPEILKKLTKSSLEKLRERRENDDLLVTVNKKEDIKLKVD